VTGGWRDDASCRGKNPDLWHSPATIGYAKSVCRRCPVRDVCLAEAVAAVEPYGVWGGLTALERNVRRYSATEQERLLVLAEVGRGASSVRDLMDRVGIDDVTARRHLGRLERDGLVVVSRSNGRPLRVEVSQRVAS